MFEISLTGKSVVVIGGARGIGAAVCRVFTQAGAKVAWTHLGNQADSEASRKLKEDIRIMGGECFDAVVNCTDETGTKLFVEQVVKKWDRLNGLVYCAGFTSSVPFLNITAEEWRKVVDVNLNGAFIAVQAVVPYMQKEGPGAIVLVGSAAIVSGGGGRADYVSAKAGLEGLNRAITKEFAPSNIRCNVIHPSLIETDLLKQRHPDPAKRAKLAAEVPLRRLGQPEDVANAALFLVSEKSSYITGQFLFIDGGRTFCK